MMHQVGARLITAGEANARAYLKYLLVKELYQLQDATFLHGEVMAYLAETEQRFEVCVASAILYHMSDPAGFLERCAQVSRRLFSWTHYAIPETIAQHPVLKDKITDCELAEFRGHEYTLYHYAYQEALGWEGFCGGAATTCRWITRDAIMAILRHCGYHKVDVLFDEPEQHPNGPHLCLMTQMGGGS